MFDVANFKEIVHVAADLIRNDYEAAQAVEKTRKADGSFVTQTEHRVTEFLNRELNRLLPGCGWLSEEDEDSSERLSFDRVWIVDPVDGTREFLAGVPEFALSIGLVENGRPVAGAVMNPVTREGGLCVKGQKPDFWGLESKTSMRGTLAEAVASVSRTEVKRGQVEPYRALFKEIRPIGSVAYKLLRVAAGLEDVSFTVAPKSEWDICGGIALLNGAGQEYWSLDRNPLIFNLPNPLLGAGSACGSATLLNSFIPNLRLLV
jgi:myo-inositol-1(or 4)-monophosphatase